MTLVVLLEMACGSRRRSAPATQGPPPAPEEHYDIAYFRAMVDKGGLAAIVDGLYVAPPSIFPSLMDGIASGTPEWLDLYRQLRQETNGTGASGTVAQLDEALARGLAKNATGILRFARVHPAIPLAEICSRLAPRDGDRAEVLDASELLAMVRRERALEGVNDQAVKSTRDACLEATRPLVRRQLRIYLVTYGAADAARTTRPRLPEPEQRELESVLVAARRDATLRARLDGRFPDGPFRKAQIPKSVLSCCADENGRIANAEGPWELTDCITDASLPRARLLNACKVTDKAWDITFEQGGFAPQIKRTRARLTEHGWTFTEVPPAERSLSPSTKDDDYWVDCNKMSAN